MDVIVRAEDLDEVEETAHEVLALRESEIIDGKLGGHDWFVALVAEAQELLRRRRVARTRSSGRM